MVYKILLVAVRQCIIERLAEFIPVSAVTSHCFVIGAYT